MARKSPTALDALHKLRDERIALDKRETEVRNAAALELGLVALDAGADRLDTQSFKAAISRALAG